MLVYSKIADMKKTTPIEITTKIQPNGINQKNLRVKKINVQSAGLEFGKLQRSPIGRSLLKSTNTAKKKRC